MCLLAERIELPRLTFDIRGLAVSQGVLVIIDGGKGLRATVRQAFGAWALVQRCQWHKRENVVRHLPKGEQYRIFVV